MEEKILEEILLEEQRYREGKALACDLICLGATNKEISDAVGAKVNIVNVWRKETRQKGRPIRDLCEKSEIAGGLQQLSEYRGLYTQKSRDARSRKKQDLAKAMLKRGAKRKDIVKTLGISRTTLSDWEAAWRSEQITRVESDCVWEKRWVQEWDEFMARLVRPIRIAR